LLRDAWAGSSQRFAGVHIAAHDSTPMILFIGQVERFARGRGAFQEVDYPAMFGAKPNGSRKSTMRRA